MRIGSDSLASPSSRIRYVGDNGQVLTANGQTLSDALETEN